MGAGFGIDNSLSSGTISGSQVLCEGNSNHAINSQQPVEASLTRSNDLTCDDLMAQKQSSSENTAENSSLHDSSYVSLAQSTEMAGPTAEHKHTPRRGIKVPEADLFNFRKEVDENAMNRFRDVRAEIETALITHIHTLRQNDPHPRPLAIRLMVLGRNEEDTAPHIVVICPSNMYKTVQTLFDSRLAKELCEPTDQTVPQLKVLVIGHSLQLKLARHERKAYRNSSTVADLTTFCGASISPVKKPQGPYGARKRKATFGGVVKVTFEDGKSTFYGMTAGHVIENWQYSTEDGYESDHTEVPNDNKEMSARDSVEAEGSVTLQLALDSQSDVGSEAWDIWERERIRDILNNSKLLGVATGNKDPSRDWALFKINSPKPNELCNPVSLGRDRGRQLLAISRPTFHDDLSDPVIIMGGSNGPKEGELSSLPGRILTGCNESFVDAYMLELNEGNEVCDGDAGAWVVHSAAPEVYGHVVATDIFGDAYVVPLLDTFDEIKECMGAISVELPSAEDCVSADSDEASVADDLVASASVKPRSISDLRPTASVECRTIVPSSAPNPYLESFAKRVDPVRDQNFREAAAGSSERRRYPYDCYAKEWDPLFSTDRNFKEDSSYVELKRGIEADGDDFGIFLRDSEDSVPSCESEEVEEFCQGARLVDLQSGAGIAGHRRGAWLDDRSSALPTSSRCVREYENPLTATALYRHLKEQRFDKANTPDANRRLIYIPNLNPYYILALAETASFHQVPALRDAIWKHLALQTSIRVRIPHRGFSTFQLEFHIPYFALRTCPPPKAPLPKTVNGNPPRQWIDLSFLQIQPPASQGPKSYGIHEAQVSFVICGSDDRRWVGYAFVDNSFDYEDLGEHDFLYEGIQEDPIASDGELDANLPIWDPRGYFLMICEIRIAKVLKEWEYLVRTVERSVKRYRNQHSSALSQNPEKSGDHEDNDVKRTFDWTQRTVELLSQLQGVLSETIKAWERFSSSKGDICYFSDPDSSRDAPQRTRLSLRAIKETIETMEGLQQKLLLLDKSCRNSAEALQLRLTLEGSEAAQHNVLTTKFTVLVLTPVALTIAYISIPAASISFKLDPKYFIVAVLLIMGVVRLLFLIVCAIAGRPWWWKKITAWVKKLQLDGMDCGRLVLRRGRNDLGRDADGIEMNNLEV